MNKLVDTVATVALSDAAAAERPALRQRVRSRFYSGMTAALLVTVLVGFAPTFYLKDFLDPQRVEAGRVWVHGGVLTAWFVIAFVQAMLVATRRVNLHRRLGWIAAATGVAAVVTGMHVTLAAVQAQAIMARTVWSNFANSLAFTVFLVAAILLRRDSETHKRLILLASIAFVQPAVARIMRWPPFFDLGVPPLVLSVFVSFLFVIALAVHDVATRNKLHAATLLGGGFLIAARLLAVFVISASDWGRAVVRWFV